MTFEVRRLTSERDLRACVELQRLVWGADYDELVPPTVLRVAQKIGGVAAGAFGDDGAMLGFVFGMAGVRDGKIIHWSDMLAVREDARDRGVGQRLKDFQRTAARAAGATTMYWTYDPLVARNAHVNFNRLRVRVDEYVEDMYGDSASELHRGLGTDRFIVAWALDDDRRDAAEPSLTLSSDEARAPVLNRDAAIPSASTLAEYAAAPAVRVEIPLDIIHLRDRAPADAANWRSSTRRVFRWALGSGYAVDHFATDVASGRGWYVMRRLGGGAAGK